MSIPLPVNEIFASIQGEGSWTGRASWFVRFQGCPVGCGWCDTKHTWPKDARMEVSRETILAKTHEPSAQWAAFTPREIVEAFMERPRVDHVILTGGEPALHDLEPLIEELSARGYSAQMETSCCFDIPYASRLWITGSPKINMAGGFDVKQSALRAADEIKFPVGKASDVELLRQHVLPFLRRDIPIYLQPLSQSRHATELCVAAALDGGWNVSIQAHKYIGLR